MSRRMRFVAFVGVLAGVLTAVWAHEGHQHAAIEAKGIRTDEEGRLLIEATARRALGLTTAEVELRPLEETTSLTARVVVPWSGQAFATTWLEGVVRELRARQGQAVEAGEVLAVVESLPLLALRQQLAQTRIELALAEENVRRVRALGEVVVPGRELLSLEALRDERRSAVRTFERKVELVAPIGTATVAVRAPIAGFVDAVDVVLGQHVEPREHLFHVQDLGEVWLELEVPEGLAGRIERGQAVRASFPAAPGRAFEGEVDFVEATVDPALHVRRAYVPLQNSGGALLPEMFGAAELVLGRSDDAFVLPAEAVVTDGAERYVFLQEEEGVYRKKAVVVGRRQGASVEVLDGVYPGDVVVTQGNHQLASLFVQGTLELSEAARQTIALEFEEVDLRTVDRVLVANARVVAPPERRGRATTRMEGRIERMRMVLGQRVEAGAPVADVSSLELQTVQLDLFQRFIELGLVERQLQLVEDLTGRGISARKELVRLTSEALALRSRIAALERQLIVMGLGPDDVQEVLRSREVRDTVTVRAPVAGRVASIGAVLGQVVHPGDSIVELLDPAVVWVEGSFFEQDMPGLLAAPDGLPVTVTAVAHPGRRWTSPALFTARSLRSGRVLSGWVELEEPDPALLPGMQATLTVIVERPAERVIAVPLAALLRVGRNDYAFVEKKRGFRRVEVGVGRRDDRYAEVLTGLFPGDRVAVRGVNELNNALSALR